VNKETPMSYRPLTAAVVGLATVLMFGAQSPAGAAGDVEAGAKIFRKCQACHTLEPGKTRVGPSLYQVIGRPAGSLPGFRYSPALKAAGEKGLVWSQDTVARWVGDPKAFLEDYLGDQTARPRMAFRLRNEKERRQVAAFLNAQAHQ